MARHRLTLLVVLLMPAVLVAGTAGPPEGSAYHWNIDANGTGGELDLTAGPGGRISGTLSGIPVEGWLVGRHLVLLREGPDGRETWEAWLGTPENVHGDDRPILAGTYLLPGGDGPLPWFGYHQAAATAGAAPAPPRATTEAVALLPPITNPPQTGSQPPAPTRAPAAESRTPGATAAPTGSATVAPRLPTGQPAIAGLWQTPDGPLEIRQNGSRLTFVLPDREVSGRLTGSDTLIGGFGPGCCKGRLEQAFNVIHWDNGTRWFRK